MDRILTCLMFTGDQRRGAPVHVHAGDVGVRGDGRRGAILVRRDEDRAAGGGRRGA
jgi:hypothetical protein